MSGRAIFDASSVCDAILCDCELPKLDATQKGGQLFGHCNVEGWDLKPHDYQL